VAQTLAPSDPTKTESAVASNSGAANESVVLDEEVSFENGAGVDTNAMVDQSQVGQPENATAEVSNSQDSEGVIDLEIVEDVEEQLFQEDTAGAVGSAEAIEVHEGYDAEGEWQEDWGEWEKGAWEPQALPPCKFFLMGHCALGAKCRFPHEGKKASETVCKYFLQGYCARGADCMFLHHEGSGRISAGTNAAVAPTKSLASVQFKDDSDESISSEMQDDSQKVISSSRHSNLQSTNGIELRPARRDRDRDRTRTRERERNEYEERSRKDRIAERISGRVEEREREDGLGGSFDDRRRVVLKPANNSFVLKPGNDATDDQFLSVSSRSVSPDPRPNSYSKHDDASGGLWPNRIVTSGGTVLTSARTKAQTLKRKLFGQYPESPTQNLRRRLNPRSPVSVSPKSASRMRSTSPKSPASSNESVQIAPVSNAFASEKKAVSRMTTDASTHDAAKAILKKYSMSQQAIARGEDPKVRTSKADSGRINT
jgi:hypothetical protein